jgi:peroxiredoxin Q/BCP
MFFNLNKCHTIGFIAAVLTVVASFGLGRAARAQDGARPQNVTKPPVVGDIAPDFELDELGGKQVKLSTLAKAGPVVLVMLRGFPGYQCPICTAQVGQLIGKSEAFKKANARVLLVYPGPAAGLKEHAGEFVRGKDMPANFYLALDPDFSFTNLYGLRWVAENETSYPSTFVLDPQRKVLFAKVSKEHGDRAKVEDVLAALAK